jgi:hypothetical protein
MSRFFLGLRLLYIGSYHQNKVEEISTPRPTLSF